MIIKTSLKFFVLTSAALAWAASAQEPEVSDDEAPLTLLDQTVPVAEEETPPDGPQAEIDDGLTERERMMLEFERFKDLKARGINDEAENVAKRVIEMSIRVNGPESVETAKALNNLAILQHLTGDYEAAQQNFMSAIEIIRDNEDKLSPKLVNPLKGLGESQLESGRPDLAVRSYQQAVHISHVNEGPHNLEQVTILEGVAEARLRLGEVEDAKDTQDMIYALNIRHHDGNAMNLVEPLMRRARWQRRTGYTLDERATYRRIIRIIETKQGKESLELVDPLMKLGMSYFYPDINDSSGFQAASMASGEMYFKRAVRLSEGSEEPDWRLIARTKLGLGDYYTFRSDPGRARKTYAAVWELLSSDDERMALRSSELEQVNVLNEDPIPQYVGAATREDVAIADDGLRQGRIVVSFDINTRGRVSSLRIVEENPTEFQQMRRFLVREFRSRVFRPRFDNASPVRTEGQMFTHTFFYQQEDLDRMRAEAGGESGDEG